MFSRWYARWNFNGVLMAGARVCSRTSKARAERRERRRRWGSRRKNGADEDPHDGLHVSLPRSSECICSTADFKFPPLGLYFTTRETRHVAKSAWQPLNLQLVHSLLRVSSRGKFHHGECMLIMCNLALYLDITRLFIKEFATQFAGRLCCCSCVYCARVCICILYNNNKIYKINYIKVDKKSF